MDEVGLGKRLQKARQAAGMTQQELCHKASLSYSTLAKIERGAIKSPSIFTIQHIAAALQTSLSELMGEAPPITAKRYRSKTGIEFIYFDINGCLVRFFQRAFAELSKDTGVGSDVIEAAFWHYNDRVCRGEMSMPEFNAVLGKRLGVERLDWLEYYMSAISRIDEMSEVVLWAAQHYRVGLLSNIMPGYIDTMLQRGLLPSAAYDQIIDSSQVGAIKPESEIYAIAQKRAALAPEKILLIDDSRANVMAAEHAGWKVLWFDAYRPEESSRRVRELLEPAEEVNG